MFDHNDFKPKIDWYQFEKLYRTDSLGGPKEDAQQIGRPKINAQRMEILFLNS